MEFGAWGRKVEGFLFGIACSTKTPTYLRQDLVKSEVVMTNREHPGLFDVSGSGFRISD